MDGCQSLLVLVPNSETAMPKDIPVYTASMGLT